MRQHLIVVPFHDWRKCKREGFRTRDAHLTEALARTGAFEKILVVSRPITRLELALRRESRRTATKPILEGPQWHVFVDRGCHIFEYFDPGILDQLLNGRSWFFKAYGSNAMSKALVGVMRVLGMDRPAALHMNVRSSRLARNLAASGIPVVFDAWDNFCRFPFRTGELQKMTESYRTFADLAPLWFTNAEENRVEFQNRYGVTSCVVVPNGVDPDRFRDPHIEPEEYKGIPQPRAFFGGKITHLFDYELFNEVVRRLPAVQFILAGQILDRVVWSRIRKHRPNVHYVGDVHYDDYPAYVKASEVCIIPYVEQRRSHGVDSIKLYEYVAARRRVVATRCNSSMNGSPAVMLADSPEEFASAILRSIECGWQETEGVDKGCSWDDRARIVEGYISAMHRRSAA